MLRLKLSGRLWIAFSKYFIVSTEQTCIVYSIVFLSGCCSTITRRECTQCNQCHQVLWWSWSYWLWLHVPSPVSFVPSDNSILLLILTNTVNSSKAFCALMLLIAIW